MRTDADLSKITQHGPANRTGSGETKWATKYNEGMVPTCPEVTPREI